MNTTNFDASRADMTLAIRGADVGTLNWAWDRVQTALSGLPVITRCQAQEAVERERLLGERAALLAERPVLINR